MSIVTGAMTTGNVLAAQLSPGIGGVRKRKAPGDTDGYVAGDEDADDKRIVKGKGAALLTAIKRSGQAGRAQQRGVPTVNTSRNPY